VLTSANGELLPPNTGPWPEGYVTPNLPPSQPARPTRLTQVSGVVARQWDSWQQLGQRIDQVLNQRSRASRPSIRPALGPITSGFGRRAGFWGVLAIHTGVDISLPIGTSVLSTADGVVTFSGWSAQGYGQTVQVRHDNGLVTLYGHLSRSLVSVGQSVSQGQPIALSGNSGISTGPHLHYEIRLNGVAVDPNRYW
jgi:murein DD-endopeptidase MepM/ murein hydrolase activator NlpD